MIMKQWFSIIYYVIIAPSFYFINYEILQRSDNWLPWLLAVVVVNFIIGVYFIFHANGIAIGIVFAAFLLSEFHLLKFGIIAFYIYLTKDNFTP
ncbi:MAG: hypothetical protein LC098_11990 [Burkholderiales bacterium]|nr:hypothetical protein [Burkholderiales bacterium]